MKRTAWTICVLSLLLTASVAETGTTATGVAGVPAASRFQLGKHYQLVGPAQPAAQASDRIEIVEVFWYGCPHCYEFEKHFNRWLQSSTREVNLVRMPATFSPAKLHAQAFYTAEMLGKSEVMHPAFFTEIHERGNRLETEEKLAAFFQRFGVTQAQFKSAFDSSGVQDKIKNAHERARAYRMLSVPWVVINGQFASDPQSAGGNEAMIDLLNELTATKRTTRD